MFIRESTSYSRSAKKNYTYHKLVENYRTTKGSRQRVIFNLGILELDKKYWKELSSGIENRLLGLQDLLVTEDSLIKKLADSYTDQILKKRKAKSAKKEIFQKDDLENIHVDSIDVTKCRTYGAEISGYEYMKNIGLEKIIDGLELPAEDRQIIKALIIGKLVHPASENETHRWLRSNSGLGEILNINFTDVGKDRIYRAGDKILKNKTIIEETLNRAEKRNLKLENKIILYDLTNTFLEGSGKKNDYAYYGHSKEKRSDCPLVTLALAVDERGYPKASKVYKGNEVEARTVKEIIEGLQVEKPELNLFSVANIIMDRGLATKKNIQWLKEKGYNYVVIERRDVYSEWEKEFEKIKEFSVIEREDYAVKIKRYIKDEEYYLLCESEGKQKKEFAIIEAKEKKMEAELTKIKQGLLKKKKTSEQLNNQLSRLKERYIGFYSLYTITLVKNKQKNITDLIWSKDDSYRKLKAGRYVIRTNNINLLENEIWNIYMLLHKVENAFRTLKNDLLMRPIYHQTDLRTESHIFITVLAYHILNCIEEKLETKENAMSWLTVKMLLETHQIVSIQFFNDKNEMHIIRKSTLPEEHHREIYKLLDIDEYKIIRKKREVMCKIK